MPKTAPGLLRALSVGACAGLLVIATPNVAHAADFVVTAIPQAGWINGPDNTGGGSLTFVEGPASPPVGRSSLAVAVTAPTDITGIGRPILQPLSAITAGSWSTYAEGDSGNPDAEPPALKFGMNRLGLTTFTTLVVEVFRNGGVTPGEWQTTTLDDSTEVWQTNQTGAFCIQSTPCTFAAFKAQYPLAAVIGLQVAVGSGTGATTSYLDAVSLTISGTTDNWDFEIPADQNSTATIGAVTPNATGGAAPVTLTASALAAGPVDFFILVAGVPTIVTVDPGQTVESSVTVPFGVTTVEVLAQDTVIATSDLTVAQPTTPSPTPTPSATPTPTPTSKPTSSSALAASGNSVAAPLALGAAMIATGLVAVVATRRRQPHE